MTLEINRFAWSTPRALHKHPPILKTVFDRSGPGRLSPHASSDYHSSTFSLEGGRDGLLMRVSNEGLPRPRVARAGRHLVCPLFYFMRNAFEFSPEAVVTVRSTRPFLTPLGTVVVMLLLVC